jgi:hypothetical protein
MNYKKTFEDDVFVYELTVQPSPDETNEQLTFFQGDGYYCQWTIKGKKTNVTRQVAVTDDDCEVIVYNTVEAAVKGAREFLSI